MNGIKFYLQEAPTTTIQNRFYNGWTHDHYVSCVLVFAPNGTIIMAGINLPGCMHDSEVAHTCDIYDKLEKIFEDFGVRCTVDSAFSTTRLPHLIKSGQKSFATIEDAQLGAEGTSMRQGSEWGMRAFRSSFPRANDRILYEEHGRRYELQLLLILLYNYRANKVGINQIRNVYMPSFNFNSTEMHEDEWNLTDDENDDDEGDQE